MFHCTPVMLGDLGNVFTLNLSSQFTSKSCFNFLSSSLSLSIVNAASTFVLEKKEIQPGLVLLPSCTAAFKTNERNCSYSDRSSALIAYLLKLCAVFAQIPL